ncbi:protein AHNAK2-like [Salarias fasciatus]|uniref:protein AHNAK2-like n=1 Tax=Salarias fasciatus TaxID=181472 RepID=UPI001176793E|nr:protein AHNAK2-like [Salarias fasciatus]
MKVEVKPPEVKIKSPEIGITQPKVSQKDVNITLPDVRAEVKLSEGELEDTDAKSTEASGSPLKFKMPTIKMPKFGVATHDTHTLEMPSAEKTAQMEDIKVQQDVTVTFKGPSIDIKTDVSKATTSGSETQKDEMEAVGPGSPSKFKLPSLKMPRLSFSRTKSEEENVPVDTEHREDKEEVKAETKEGSKSPKPSPLGNILKTIDVEFDVPNAEKVKDSLETSKKVKISDEAPGNQVDKEATKSPERTGWFSFRFGLSSPSEAPKTSEKDLKKSERSPAGETGDEDVSPSCSVQSSDAFADISSTVTSELVGPSISSPTKVTVKYSDPGVAAGPEEIQSNIITSMARTELLSEIPNLPEKITIPSSGVSSSSEDTLRLESGKIHVITSNIQATPESQHARLLTAIQVQPAASVSLMSEENEASSWTMEKTQGGVKTVFERRVVKETSSESTETMVITKQISHVFESSEPISGETASSIQRLRDTVHSEKMKFFDEAEK